MEKKRPLTEKHISKEEAIRALMDAWEPEIRTEEIALIDADGRTLAEDLYAMYDQPVYRASRMDGIAVDSARFAAALPDTGNWKLGVDYVRADTGDDFDDAFDAVIAIEDVTMLEGGGIKLAEDIEVRPGSNVGGQGNNIRKGTQVGFSGRRLKPQDLAALVLGGYDRVKVYKKPVIAFIPTGSELVPAGSELKRGQNFDSNSIMVNALLKEMGADVVLLPIVKDDKEAIEDVLNKTLPGVDVVILNAGTSKGGEDYCYQYLKENGNMLFHGVAAVPGRPMSITMIGKKPVINMSGPAVAAMYGCRWLMSEIIDKMVCSTERKPFLTEAVLTEDLGVPPMFSMFSGLDITIAEDGRVLAAPIARNRGMSAGLLADAHYVSTPGEQPHKAGDKILVTIEH